ncbi:MAG: DUF4199 domain-containing protein [Bacteroidales bacterium]
MENRTSAFLKSALNSGLIFGVILVIIQLAFWMFNFIPVGIGKSMLMLLFNLTVYIVGVWWFTKSYRNGILNGFISYGHAYLYGLTVIIFSTILVIIYNYIFNAFIDPEYTTRVLKTTANWTEEFMRNKGMSETQISDTIAKIMAKAHPSAISTALKSLLGGVIMGAIVSLISSAIAKKVENPIKES